MKLKHLLTLGVVALCTLPSWGANTITVDGSPMFLKYSDADKTGILFEHSNNGNNAAGEIAYTLDVQKPGDYLLYFTTGNKNLGNHAFHVFVNDDETGIACGPYAECGGNWYTAIVVPVEVTLPQGEVSLKIRNDDGCSRWYFFNDEAKAPYLIQKDDIPQVGEEEVSLDVIRTAVGSTQNYTAIHWNNNGNTNGVPNVGGFNTSLISGSGNTKKANEYSAFPKTKLLYRVNASKTGNYPVTVTGIFRDKSGILDKSDYTLNVKVNDNTVAITNFSKSDDYSSAKGMLHLEEGVNVIELSTDYNTSTDTQENILFCLSDFTFSPALEDVPFVSGDNSVGYIGHEFTITGLITNAPEVPYSVHVYLAKDDDEIDLGEVNINENNDGFELVISEELSKQYFSEAGSYNLTAKMFEGTGEEPVAVSDSFVLTMDYQTFMFTLTSAQRGSLKATFGESNSATASNNTNYLRDIPEGEEVEFTVTPNEGYFATKISVTDSEGTTVDYTMTRDDNLNQWNSWNIFYFSDNFEDFITCSEDGDICTFKLTATQPYTVAVSYEQHVRLIEVDLDACSPKDNVKVINNNADNWNDNAYRQYSDPELGYNIFWRNMPYGQPKDIYFIQPEGTTISRLLVNNEEVEYDFRNFKEDVINGVHYYVDMKQNYRLHAIFAYNEFPITVNQTSEEDENNGKIENGSIAFEQLTKLSTPDTEEGEGEETEEPVAVDEDANLIVPEEDGTLTLTGVENGVKSLRIHVTPEDGYYIANVSVNGKDFTDAIEDLVKGGSFDYLVNSKNLDVKVSFRPNEIVVTVGDDKTSQSGSVSDENVITLFTEEETASVFVSSPVQIFYYIESKEEENEEGTGESPDFMGSVQKVKAYANVAPEDWTPADLNDDGVYEIKLQNNTTGILHLATMAGDDYQETTQPYSFTVSSQNPTSVDKIIEKDMDAEYYTLQGVKVQNPERGIYIKVQNGKASKVILQ